MHCSFNIYLPGNCGQCVCLIVLGSQGCSSRALSVLYYFIPTNTGDFLAVQFCKCIRYKKVSLKHFFPALSLITNDVQPLLLHLTVFRDSSSVNGLNIEFDHFLLGLLSRYSSIFNLKYCKISHSVLGLLTYLTCPPKAFNFGVNLADIVAYLLSF